MALLVCTLVAPVWADQEAHVVLVDEYPPYYSWDNGKPEGTCIEIIQEAFNRMGEPLDLQRSTWKRSLYDVEHGNVAGLCAGAWASERTEFAVFPKESISVVRNWAVTLKGAPFRLETMEDLRGRSVGIVDGYTYGAAFDSMEGVKKELVLTEPLLLKRLLSGRIPIAIGDRTLIEHLAKQFGGEVLLDFQMELESHPLYLLFSKKYPRAQQLADSMDKALRAMRAEGLLQ